MDSGNNGRQKGRFFVETQGIAPFFLYPGAALRKPEADACRITKLFDGSSLYMVHYNWCSLRTGSLEIGAY